MTSCDTSGKFIAYLSLDLSSSVSASNLFYFKDDINMRQISVSIFMKTHVWK